MLLIGACTPGNGPSSHGVAPTITSVNIMGFTEGIAGTFTVTATGTPTPTFALTGTLPSGVTFDNTTGILSGTPAGGSSGTYPLTITASNGVSPDATQGFSLVVIAPSTTTLIVYDSASYTDSVTTLTSIMEAAGLTVTTSDGVPASDLNGYGQIWDVRFQTALTSDDMTSYTTYISVGRTLVLIGEHTGFMVRNNTILSLISTLGGGDITIGGESTSAETVQSPFNSPDAVSTVTWPDSGYATSSGTGMFITESSATAGSSLYFARGTLSKAIAGRLMVVFDIDHLTGGYGPDFHSLTDNMVKLP